MIWSGAMLLFDEINRKGFEGDLVLMVFRIYTETSRFKDQKQQHCWMLLKECSQIYIQQQCIHVVHGGALNILNEARYHFKMARNKRLHVALCLIKLNFSTGFGTCI